ncbi:MAG: exonuclease domain-containing protein [Pseudomonadota bacterium]
MFDRPIAFVDLETTGANAAYDRVTEVGIVEVDQGRLVGEWSTLVNPETSIPPAIQALTGITNAMVVNAPTFAELAGDVLERLEGRLFVAHNARFDYSFLREEFKRLGVRYAAPVVCTVKLSRKLYAGHRRHNLDSLIERHGLACGERHRALGDARVLWEFLQRVRAEKDPALIEAAVAGQLKAPSLPAGVSPTLLDELRESPGVYVFYGAGGVPLYVGKSVNLRSRVMAHFAGDRKLAKDLKIAQQVEHVEWIETAGELGALMQEARLVKELNPVLNRQLKAQRELCAWRFDPANPKATPELVYAREVDFAATPHVYGLFRAKTDAVKALRAIAEQHKLCPIVLGLERGKGPCFSHQIKRCRGACCGRESLETHALRLAAALTPLRIRAWPYRGRVGVRERDAGGERTELHVLDRWCYLGTLRADWELFDAAALRAEPSFDLDTYKILTRFLAANAHRVEVVDLAG